ncbi:MAG TPA: hypothetical protein VM734_05215 [Kofleriaceae bacterium]|nr:hypothetical protein [Kofleriaceae bacterium]
MNDPDAHAAANARGLKVHLRLVPSGAMTYRVVTLRPVTRVRFSTNYFHDTWHILTGRAGAMVLGRLLWGLAFQRQPGTLVLIDAPHLVSTPFEADRADPILLVPAGLTSVEASTLRELRRRLRTPGPGTTIRWQTFGLPAALEGDRDGRRWSHAEQRTELDREQMSRRGGFVCYTAPASLLRAHAVGIYAMSDCVDMTYYPLAERRRRRWSPDGEVQVFHDFDRDVAAAAIARREVVGADRPLVDDEERWAVWRRKDAVSRAATDRRRRTRRRRRSGPASAR